MINKIKLLKLKIREYGLLKIYRYVFEKYLYKKNLKKAKKSNGEYQSNIYFETKSKFIFEDLHNTNLDFINKKEIIISAEKILENKFDILGSGLISLGKNIKWNQDFKTGFIWENKFYKDIEIINLTNNSDVKVPWELSRFQYLITLGKAYMLTKDLRYYEKFKEYIYDWIEKNPIYYSVNWTCNMDVSIRAINWIAGYYLFKENIDKDKEFRKILNTSLYGHGEYIYNNLEKTCVSLGNNHYLSNLNGLIFLGVYFKDLSSKSPKKWLNKGVLELEKEMFIQNNEDGTNYETSTSYHRLVTELMFFPLLLLEKNNYFILSKEYKIRLKKMFEFMAKITNSNGKVPLIGDVDNGRLFIFSNFYDWEVNDFRNLISLGGEYFDDSYLREISKNQNQDALFLFGEIKKEMRKIEKKSYSFPIGGYYLLQNMDIYCLIRCGELSLRGQGGHSHNDQLSLVVNIQGEDFFIDPGVYVYTANKVMRNLFRSTEMHNTIRIKNYEQNNFFENNLFEMKEESFSKLLKFKENIFSGEHSGYLKKTGSKHIRTVELLDREIIIRDDIGNDSGEINFCLNAELEIKKIAEDEVDLKNKNISIKLKAQKAIKVLNSYYSNKYGVILNNKSLRIIIEKNSEIRISILNN